MEEKLAANRYEDSELVFVGVGGLVNRSNLRQRSFARLLKRAGLPLSLFTTYAIPAPRCCFPGDTIPSWCKSC